MIKVLFIINSSKFLSKRAREALDLCISSKKLNCKKVYTTKSKDAIQIALNGANDGANLIVAVGGDGTCNEVLNGILSSENSSVVMGIIPNGTGNDFQRMFGEFIPERFLELIESQNSSKIDILKVNAKDKHHFALNIAGGGFDGFVVNILENQRKKLKLDGKISYAIAILRCFLLYKRPIVELKSREFNYFGECLLVAACNGTTFGHGLVIHPEAKLDSGKIAVTLMGKVTLLDYVKNLYKLKVGCRIDHPEVKYFTTNEISIRTIHTPLYSQADGEFLSNSSIKVEALPAALYFLH